MDLNGVAGGILSSKGLTAFTFATTFITVSIVWTVLKQILCKNPNEPPVVFHLVPIIGSTVTYGIDPYKFYFDCQAKVSNKAFHRNLSELTPAVVWRRLHLHPTW